MKKLYNIVLSACESHEVYSSGPCATMQGACAALLTQLANCGIDFDSDVLNALGVVLDKAMYDETFEPYEHYTMSAPEDDFVLVVNASEQ